MMAMSKHFLVVALTLYLALDVHAQQYCPDIGVLKAECQYEGCGGTCCVGNKCCGNFVNPPGCLKNGMCSVCPPKEEFDECTVKNGGCGKRGCLDQDLWTLNTAICAVDECKKDNGGCGVKGCIDEDKWNVGGVVCVPGEPCGQVGTFNPQCEYEACGGTCCENHLCCGAKINPPNCWAEKLCDLCPVRQPDVQYQDECLVNNGGCGSLLCKDKNRTTIGGVECTLQKHCTTPGMQAPECQYKGCGGLCCSNGVCCGDDQHSPNPDTPWNPLSPDCYDHWLCEACPLPPIPVKEDECLTNNGGCAEGESCRDTKLLEKGGVECVRGQPCSRPGTLFQAECQYEIGGQKCHGTCCDIGKCCGNGINPSNCWSELLCELCPTKPDAPGN